MVESTDSSGGHDNQKRRRKPSTGFPVIGLPDVVAMLAKAAQHGWEHTVAEIAGYLGHSTTNSGAFRMKLAALRDYGVISGRGSSLVISDTGRTIAIPERPEDRTRALQDAFLNTVFGSLYEEAVKGTPLEIDNLARRAVNKIGIAAASQGSFADVFTKSAVEAGLGEVLSDGRITLYPRGERIAPAPDETGTKGSLTDAAFRVSTTRSGSATRSTPVLDQRWSLGPDGEVAFTISLDRPLSAADFASIGAVVQQVERLVDGLRAEDASG